MIFKSNTHSQKIFFLCAMLILIACVPTGCRTASSLGIPVSSGSNYLLSDAVKIRQSVGHQAGIPTEMQKVNLPAHRVEAGDVLVIEPNDFNSPVRLPGDQTVQQDGTIELGQYGRLQVMGKSAEEIQAQVSSMISGIETSKFEATVAQASYMPGQTKPQSNVDYGVAVRLVNQDSALFYVMGEVNSPGSYPLVGHETVLDAIIAAGGLSGNANDHKIIVTRPQLPGRPRVILPACYQQILQMGDVTTNYQLMPGDRIYVPSITILEDVKQTLQWRNEKSCPHCQDYSKNN